MGYVLVTISALFNAYLLLEYIFFIGNAAPDIIAKRTSTLPHFAAKVW
jgi:hypothetical protein